MSADPLPQPSGGSTFTGITLSLLVAFSSIAINLLIPILSPLLLIFRRRFDEYGWRLPRSAKFFK